ncbi:MAG: hypothetical protein LW703_14330 [Rhodobacter sp.]|jgi:hypothetical protein|nr:hypothetical protein [Rhodobacter sp.]
MKTLYASILLSIAAASPIYALDLVQWGTAGDWVVMQDPNRDNACLTQVELSDGTLLRIGFEDKGKKGFLATFNPAWKDFKLDNKYPVGYALDDVAFEGEAHGREVNGVPGAQVSFENVDFLVDLAKKRTLTFFYEGAEIVKVDLKGSDEAIKAMVACQAEQG